MRRFISFARQQTLEKAAITGKLTPAEALEFFRAFQSLQDYSDNLDAFRESLCKFLGIPDPKIVRPPDGQG